MVKPRVIALFGILAVAALLTTAFAERSGETAPGEQRPFTSELRRPETDPAETAAWEERMALAVKYTNLSHLISLAIVLLLPCAAAAFHFLRFGEGLYRLAGQRTNFATWITAFAISLWVLALTLPFIAFRTYLAAANGLLSAGFWSAFGGSALAGLIIALAAGVFLAAVSVLMRRVARLWWAVAAGGLVLVVLAVGPLYPRRLPLSGISGEPMAEDKSAELVRNLTEPGTGESLRLYVDRTGDYSGLIWAQSAVFSKEVIVSEGALDKLTPYELEVLVAHELAYFETGYRVIGFLIIVILILTGTFLTDSLVGRVSGILRREAPPDPRGTGVLVTVMLAFFILAFPVLNGYSRLSEKAADDFAIRLTRKPVTAAELYRKEAAANLSAPKPNAFLHLILDPAQPPTDRIAQARALRQELAR